MTASLSQYPEIGTLVRRGIPIYYVTLADNVYVEHEDWMELAAYVDAERRALTLTR
jgi:hypothetical protein